MEDASTPTFRPTRQQALGRGLYRGALAAVVSITTAALGALLLAWVGSVAPPTWLWPVLAFGPPVAGGVLGVLVGRRTRVEICAGGIRSRSILADGLAPWSRMVDLRAERRGGRTVVSVYLDSGACVQLNAPYSGGLLTADPGFEGKIFALSYMWRSRRFGGLPG